MKRLLTIYIPIVILTLLVSLPFLVPSRLIWSGISSYVLHSGTTDTVNLGGSAFEINLSDFDGVFLGGSVSIAVNKLSMGKVHWEVLPSAILDGQLGASVRFKGPFHDFSGLFSSNGEYLQISHLVGQVGAEAITPFSSAYGFYADGTLLIRDISIKLERRWLTQLTGEVFWDGGSIQYRNMNARATYPLPPLTGLLSLVESKLAFKVIQTQGSLLVIDSTLQASGWGAVNIYRRFFDLSGKKWLATETADDIALMVEQKLW
jgi:hypothetical protein